MSEQSRDVARRFVDEFVNQRKLHLADELFTEEFIDHSAGPTDPPGVEGLKQFFGMMDHGFPDFDGVLEDVFGEDDKVAIRFTFHGTHQGEFMGIPPTAKRVTMSGIDILRIENSKIAELWGQEDMLGMMVQLDVLPSPVE